jgi:hypothetical protein
MLIPLADLLVILRSLVRSRLNLQLENLALPHQINVFRRSAKNHAKLTSGVNLEGSPPLGLSVPPPARLPLDVVIVKPETVVAWHRKCFGLFWTWKVRHGQPGRPAVAREIRDLIRNTGSGTREKT